MRMAQYELKYIKSLNGKLVKEVQIGNTTFYDVYLEVIASEDDYNINVRRKGYGVKANCKLEHVSNIII